MKIKILKDHATDRHFYWAGKVYDVPDDLGDSWEKAGIGVHVQERQRQARKSRDEDEEE
jgi:hypothetical protein